MARFTDASRVTAGDLEPIDVNDFDHDIGLALHSNGEDPLFGTDYDDLMIGSDGSDWMEGNGGDDRLDGNGGDDWLFGGTGNDRLTGDDGFDELHGGAGNDILDGGAGEDEIEGGDGDDLLAGGDGADVFSFSAYSGAGEENVDRGHDVITDFELGVDHLYYEGSKALARAVVGSDMVSTDYGDGVHIDFGEDVSVDVVGLSRAQLLAHWDSIFV